MKPKSIEKLFMEAYDSHADAIFRHCYFRVFDREKAKELTQETFLKTWRYLGQGKEIRYMKSFLYKIATNLVIDNSRKKKETSLEVLQAKGFEPGENPLEQMQINIEADKLLDLLKHMAPSQKELLLMRYIDGLKPKEIAEVLNETPNVVSVRIHRANAKLREIVQNTYTSKIPQ